MYISVLTFLRLPTGCLIHWGVLVVFCSTFCEKAKVPVKREQTHFIFASSEPCSCWLTASPSGTNVNLLPPMIFHSVFMLFLYIIPA